jgi:cell division septum initiation protein DivIVA
MPVINGMNDELSHYLDARQALIDTQKQVDEPTMWGDVLDPADAAPNRLEDVVATLCHQARAAQQLASAAEHLCAALVCENQYEADEAATG